MSTPIHITPALIATSDPKDRRNCAVARAIKQVVRDDVLVNCGGASVALANDEWFVNFPDRLCRAIERLVRGMPVKAMRVSLDIPAKFLRK